MARTWRCGRFEFALDRPLVMGILNVTPDSFSDGGAHEEPLAAIDWAHRMIDDGADIIDIGGESTRPGAAEVTQAEELARVRPVIGRLASETRVAISADTRHADVAAGCVLAGADILNDVSGFRDQRMVETVVGSNVGVVVMHMRGEPGTMQDEPTYADVVAEVREYLESQANMLIDAGIERERIAIDPGIGFGKTYEHNLALLNRLGEFRTTGFAVLVGASRKRFIGEATGEMVPRQRVGGSVAAAVWAVEHGADIVRVHDVGDTVQALRVTRAIGSAT